MKNALLTITTTLSLALSTQVFADNDRHQRHHESRRFAKVISVQPIYKTERIAYEVRLCPREDRDYRGKRHVRLESPAKIVLGGLIGGAIGHELGEHSHQDLATFAGAVIGTAIAHNAVYHDARQYPGHHPGPTRCHTEIRYKNLQKLVAYNVVYRYHGRVYTTRMREYPGERIQIDGEKRHYGRHRR